MTFGAQNQEESGALDVDPRHLLSQDSRDEEPGPLDIDDEHLSGIDGSVQPV